MEKKKAWTNPVLNLILAIAIGGVDTVAFVLASPPSFNSPSINSKRGLFNPFGWKKGVSLLRRMKGQSLTEPMSDETTGSATVSCFSLAGPYLVEASFSKDSETTSCRLYPLSKLKQKTDKAYQHSEGAISFDCVTRGQEVTEGSQVENEITITMPKPSHLQVQVSSPNKNTELVNVLSRIMVQFTLSNLLGDSREDWNISFEGSALNIENAKSDEELKALFEGVFDVVAGETELVEMVDSQGRAIGQLPRKLVHQFNLLHRGIGLFVTKDVPIQLGRQVEQPDLYVHQRTSTKRIFPSLYDMFVGGVSLAKEPSRLTAEREVAEELGLSRGSTQLSDRLWRCIVCTAYNRCVVDFFSYTMLTNKEAISWQEEEVAWGSFVPYSVVEASGDMSIQRLTDRKEWPGRYPPVQARGGLQEDVAWHVDERNESVSNNARQSWEDWDYVPDGLLVWEAWLARLPKAVAKGPQDINGSL
mmetsp:Transcript_3677/g.9202  ORF Transcript_3677/g.9202 Transcript_3677/m.9202 type:complete len:474 (+) Transcript_3677:2-1423(+)